MFRPSSSAAGQRLSQIRMRQFLASLIVLAAILAAPFAHSATANSASDQPVGQRTTASSASDQPVVQQLLDAMSKSDYQAFTSQGTPEFAQLGQEQFNQVATSVAPRLQQGYSVHYLGSLRQQGLDISIWKITFEDQGDDLLATLNIQDGRVGGFFLR